MPLPLAVLEASFPAEEGGRLIAAPGDDCLTAAGETVVLAMTAVEGVTDGAVVGAVIGAALSPAPPLLGDAEAAETPPIAPVPGSTSDTAAAVLLTSWGLTNTPCPSPQ